MNDNEVLKQLEQRMIEGFASIKELLVKSEDINRERMTDLKNKIEDQEKRISKLEASTSFNAGKIAGISAAISAAMTIIAFFIKGGTI